MIRARTIWGGRRAVAVPDDGHPVRLQGGSSPDNTAARWHAVVNFVVRWAGLGPGTVTFVSFKFPPNTDIYVETGGLDVTAKSF